MASSPWNNITKTEVNFLEVQDEAVAEKLQKEENVDFTTKVLNEFKVTKKLPPDSTNEPGCSKASASSVVAAIPDELTPADILAALNLNDQQGDLDSDAIIAQVLQAQFDLEYDAEIRRTEKVKNKNSKISVSYKNFRSFPDSVLDENFLELENEIDLNKKDWDRFDTNDKELSSIPKCGYKYDDDGEIVTKHNAELNGRKNACKVMSFPPEFSTGDAGMFDMKLSNRVFNELRHFSKKSKKVNRASDRKENVATAEMGVDAPTRLILFKMINNQILESVDGIVSTGKEAVILHAQTDQSNEELTLPKEVAVKIFKTTLNEFKQRDRYIKDDYRFKDRFSKNNARQVINMWAEKELHNLLKMKKVGILCPDVVVLKKHVLVMSFVGVDSVPALKLKEAVLSDAELSVAYEEILEIMHKLYDKARLVHADFSEYNILWHEGKCWVIDVAQSVAPDHPGALEFLMRDCGNIVSFFKRQGVPNVKTKEELFFEITKLDPLTHNATQLERIHMKGAPPHIVDRTSSDDTPDKFKSLDYPFDFAWDQVQQYKMDLHDSDESTEDEEPPKEVEWTEAPTRKSKKKCNQSMPVAEEGSSPPVVAVKSG